MRRRYAVLLRRPDLEDGVFIGELVQVEPLDRDAVVVCNELARAAPEGRSRAAVGRGGAYEAVWGLHAAW